jgi:hypothetical protein
MYWRMHRNKFKWFAKVWGLLSLDRRAMRIKEEEISHLKSEISYASKSHLWEVPADSWVKGKLAPRYVTFKIIDRKWEVAYQLELPSQLSKVHDVFHVSQLKKCLRVLEEQLPIEYLDLGGDLTYSERSIRILDTAKWVTHSKVIKMCKVQWSHHMEDEATWEHEEELRADYPELFPSAS